jgi:Ser/Thr protein kinase RdoA (MazF antagonist)
MPGTGPRIGPVIRDVYRRPGAEALPRHLESTYGVRVAATAKLDAGVYKVELLDGPTWVARLFVIGRSAARAEEDAGVLRFLDRQKFPAERCAHPEPVSELDGRAVLITEHVDGMPGRGTPASRRQLGDLLGRLHTLPTEPGPTQRPAGSLHHLPQYEGYPSQDLAAAHAMLADLTGRVPSEHQRTYETLQQLLPEGDGGDGLPQSFVHPDPAPSNLLASPTGAVLVDWTGAGQGPRLASLAVLLASAGPEHVDDVLAGYRAHVTLSAEELDRLEGVLWVRALWLAAWQCWLAVVSPKVTKAYVPSPERVTAIAARTRECA